MDFQEQMQNTLRTKDEVQEEAIRKLMQNLVDQAHLDFEMIKSGLLHKANTGDYRIENGQKVLTTMYTPQFSYEAYHAIGRKPQWFTMRVEDHSIQAVYDKKTHRQIKPYVFHNMVYFAQGWDAGQRLYLAAMEQRAIADKIQIKMVLWDHTCNVAHPLPSTFHDMRQSHTSKFSIAVQAAYRMHPSGAVEFPGTSQSTAKPDLFSYDTFVCELAHDEQKRQEEAIRIQERERQLAAERAAANAEPMPMPLSASLSMIFVLLVGIMSFVGLDGNLPGAIIWVGSILLGCWILKRAR